MPSIQARGNRFQLRVVDPLLPKPFFWTFDTEGEASAYGDLLKAQLARGVVPAELLSPSGRGARRPPLSDVIDDYRRKAPVSPTDLELLDTVRAEAGEVRTDALTYSWVEAYVRDLKKPGKVGSHQRDRGLTPGTIRKRVGLLARVLDWHHRVTTGKDGLNPFRLLPRGYSTYSEADAAASGERRLDASRDRRMLSEEEARIERALAGEKREGRERPLGVDPAFTMLFRLILGTGMRLSEAYRLRSDQVDLVRWVIRVEGSKGARGLKKPRSVPVVPHLRDGLREFCEGRSGLLFPFWDGTEGERRRASSKLSVRFGGLFDYAQVLDFVEHDLRHEATCRWVEMRGPDGRWLFSEIEVCKIMGWSDPRMMLRYASLRGEDLSGRWG